MTLAFAAAIVALVALALPHPASALVSESNITSPASPYRVFWDYDNPPAGPTVSGTANGPTAVDINCYYAPDPATDPYNPAHLAANVPVTSGQFSAPISFSTAFTTPCVMRAVPHGDSTTYLPGQPSNYTGATMFFGQTFTVSSGGRETHYFADPTAELGELDISSPQENGIYFSTVGNPSDLSQSPQFFESIGGLYGSGYGDPGHPDVRVGGVDAFDPETSNGNPGSPAETHSYSFDPASGDLTLHEAHPYVKCDDAPCSSYSSTGIELDRTWQTSHGNSVIAMTDVWRSTDGQSHSLAVDYEDAIQHTTNRSSFLFPGTSSFVTHDAGDTVSLPPGSGSILIKDDQTTPDSGGLYAQGAMSYASAPDAPAEFVFGDDFADNPQWLMRYRRTVPAGGSITLRFSYEQDHAMPDVRSAAAAAGQSFSPALSIASPADGATTSTPNVTVTGSASDGVQLSSLTVNGAPVSVAGDGSWSRALTLTTGANTITAVATNSDGLTTQRQITVNYALPGAAAHLALSGGLHLLTGGVRFTLACTAAQCNGQAALTATERLRGKSLVGVSAAKSRKPKLRRKTVTVGRVVFAIRAGESRAVTVSLNKTGKKLLKKFGKLPARLKITLTQAGGHPLVIKNAKLTFKPAKKKHHKRH